jgi:3-hydroxyphenylacetate 6-hydroxylase
MTNLQDCIPALRFPWSQTTKKALELRQRRDTYFAHLNDDLDERLQKGEQVSCIRAELLHRPDVDDEELNLICLTFISAGMAPTVVTLQWSLALLARRLDIQQAALQAIQEHYKDNTVIGDVDDDQGCQYIVALAKECLRFVDQTHLVMQSANNYSYFTVARTSLPRSTVKDFHYDGNVIPTGTTVFLNAWACNMGMSEEIILLYSHCD